MFPATLAGRKLCEMAGNGRMDTRDTYDDDEP